MASKICALCAKKSEMGGFYVKLRGKFNPTKKVRRYPNLQWMKTLEGKRVLACAKCIKAVAKV